ncbi:MAG TPA: ester cyclase [Solirubrobacteraceae bacterium]|nr:ester cyclase [Solirubrobacteraceae bacterium]
MTITPREAFQRGTDTFNAHDIDGFAAVLDDDVVFVAPGPTTGAGKAACAEFFAGWFRAFPDARVDVHDVHFIDDVAVEVGTSSGTHDGVFHSPAGDVPATGRRVSLDYLQVPHFRDGKHASFNLMFDRLLMLEQLGLIPASAPAA